MTDLLTRPFQEWHPFLFILLAGAIPTQMWRWIGAVLSSSLDEQSEFLKWVKAVATALVAGLIANLVVFPAGALGEIPLAVRIAALLIGFGIYFARPSHIIWGILAGEIVLITGAYFVT